MRTLPFIIVSVLSLTTFSGCSSDAPNLPGDIVFSDGFETDQRDGGRPVRLIAAALNVEPEVFREAFGQVNPAKFGAPSHSRIQENKKVLMDALSKYGVTNDRLDEVSNYYRYRPQSGKLWTHRPAKAKAVIRGDKVAGFDIIDAGAGYLTAPKVVVVGHSAVSAIAEIEFTDNLLTNGRVISIQLAK